VDPFRGNWRADIAIELQRAGEAARRHLARIVLFMGDWDFSGPSLRQGAAGTLHFEPGGVAF
jgi:hypothetical protein